MKKVDFNPMLSTFSNENEAARRTSRTTARGFGFADIEETTCPQEKISFGRKQYICLGFAKRLAVQTVCMSEDGSVLAHTLNCGVVPSFFPDRWSVNFLKPMKKTSFSDGKALLAFDFINKMPLVCDVADKSVGEIYPSPAGNVYDPLQGANKSFAYPENFLADEKMIDLRRPEDKTKVTTGEAWTI